MREIKLSEMPLVKSPESFFEAQRVAYVEVTELPSTMPPDFLNSMRNHRQVIKYHGKLFFPVILTGAPENLFLNASKGMHIDYGNGYRGIFVWGNDLQGSIKNGAIFDLSGEGLTKGTKFTVVNETDFFLQRFVIPYGGKLNI